MAGKKGVDDEKKRKKSGDGVDGNARALEKDAGYATGYETDAASTSGRPKNKLKKKTKTRKPSGDTGYETDDGYMSSAPKSKSRFFKLGNRSKPDLAELRLPVEMPPPPPPPVFRLPIAEKFARTLGDINANATMEPPLGPLSVPHPPSASVSPLPSSAPTLESVPTPNDVDKDSVDTHEPSAPETTTTKRPAVHFVSSDSSIGHSLFSKKTTSSSGSSPTSASPPKPKMVISYPLTRSSSPPSPPPIQPVVIPNLNNSSTKRVPGPLFLNRVPSDQGKLLGSYSPNAGNGSPSEWSPAGSPFVVVTPNPAATSSPTTGSRSGLLRPGTTNNSPSSRDISPARSQNDDIVPSSDYIVPSPSATPPLSAPNALAHYDLPPPSPPPTSPLPKPPVDVGDHSQSDFAAQQQSNYQQRSNLSPPSGTPLRSTSPLLGGGTQRRGRESPFPTRPVLPNSTSSSTPRPSNGFESRVRVRRYRDLYAIPRGWEDSSNDSHRESSEPSSSEFASQQLHQDTNFRRQARRETIKVGINVELPSDDEGYGGEGYGYDDASDEEMKNVLSRFRREGRSVSDSGHEEEFEPALDRSRSLRAAKDSFLDPSYSPRGRAYGRVRASTRQGSASPSASEGEGEYSDSDDRSRYPDDAMTAGRTTMYKFDHGSRGGTSRRSLSLESDSRSRGSFLDADKSEQARQRFLRKVEAMYDENGREVMVPSSLKAGRGAPGVPPVPKLSQAAVKQPPNGWF